jgi:hypothetical protein
MHRGSLVVHDKTLDDVLVADVLELVDFVVEAKLATRVDKQNRPPDEFLRHREQASVSHAPTTSITIPAGAYLGRLIQLADEVEEGLARVHGVHHDARLACNVGNELELSGRAAGVSRALGVRDLQKGPRGKRRQRAHLRQDLGVDVVVKVGVVVAHNVCVDRALAVGEAERRGRVLRGLVGRVQVCADPQSSRRATRTARKGEV